MPIRETVAQRIERIGPQPINPVDILSDGTMTIKQIAKKFGRSEKTWKRLIYSGALPACETNPLLVPTKAVVLYLADRLRFRPTLEIAPAPPRRRLRVVR